MTTRLTAQGSHSIAALLPPPSRAWWAETAAAVSARLGTDPATGLTTAESDRRLESSGRNELLEAPSRPAWRLFAAQFVNTMIVVLIVAGLITVAIGDLTDAMVIAAVVVLNAVIGFAQEHRAERAMAALRRLTQRTARVTRDGTTQTIPAGEVVVGDVLHLEAGDLVAADARLIEAPNLRANEAPLTGESVPVEKTAEPVEPGEGGLVSDRHNMVFRGTSVVYGRGKAIVTETGMATALGQIAGLLQAHASPPTPLQRQLAVLGRRIAGAAVAACGLIFIVGIARGEPAGLMFFTAVSLAVAAIPESLPAVVTVSMALGAHRMAQRHALIRKLSAVETLGSVTVIASDKTGTLTQGRMVAERVWTRDETFSVSGTGYEPTGAFTTRHGPVNPASVPALNLTLETAALCNDATVAAPEGSDRHWTTAGDPTEAALVALAGKGGFNRASLAETHPRIAEIAFDSGRRRMTTVHSVRDDGLVIAVKGAVESVVPIVTSILDSSGIRPIGAADLDAVRGALDQFGGDGYRVLAVAGRRAAESAGDDFERDLTLYGLVAIADPPRETSAEAVQAAREAGITPLMVTGDHAETAAAIARDVGILRANDQVVTGRALTDADAVDLGRRVEDITVYARTSPEQKLDIVAAWQARGDVVAMTGDGVNDAPALRKADIGIAMGINGTEVSREAADMVLADDNFATIVGAIREGRRIYDNIRRSIRFGLTGGTGEVWLIFLAPFVGLPLPLLPIQILWVNLVTHGLPGVALAVEPAEPHVLRRPPRPRSDGILSGGLWQRILLDGLLLGLVCLALATWAFATERPWQTMAFTSLALLQLGNALALRSDRESVFRLGLSRNPFLLAVLAGTLVLQLARIYLPVAQELLSTQPLSLPDLVVVLVVSTTMFWVVEFQKLYYRRRIPAGGISTQAERGEP